MSTFVSVGNAKQPFDRLLRAVRSLAEELPAPVTVQYGHNHFEESRFNCVDFLKMEDFLQLIESAELVILHGGAGSIITALTAGKTPVVMARRSDLGEHVDHHQSEFVEELAKAGKIVVTDDQQSLKSAVESVLAHHRQVPVDRCFVPELVSMIEDDLKQIAAVRDNSG